jgi:hydrogenase expression/formation protein HypC
MCLAIPGRIIEIRAEDEGLLRTGRVDFGGIVKEVNLTCTPDAQLDDYVLVHVGLAISVMDPGEAARVFEYLREIEALGEIEAPDGAT